MTGRQAAPPGHCDRIQTALLKINPANHLIQSKSIVILQIAFFLPLV
jgi:hypothetical protein